MRFRTVVFILFAFVAAGCTPEPAKEAAKAPETPAPAAAAPAAQVHGTLIQVMRGILFPSSNVIFFAQTNDPRAVKPRGDSSLATNPLESTYGGWVAVENAAISLSEAANLLTIPGRMCSNGKPVPIQNEDWPKFVQGLRDAGMKAYTAAGTKNMDNMLDAADAVSTACANCHDKYREKPGGEKDRCM